MYACVDAVLHVKVLYINYRWNNMESRMHLRDKNNVPVIIQKAALF